MSLYIDTSTLLKRYVAEDESDICEQILLGDTVWVTARHTWVEVIRNLSRLLSGTERRRVKKLFQSDWERMHIVALRFFTYDIRQAQAARSLGWNVIGR